MQKLCNFSTKHILVKCRKYNLKIKTQMPNQLLEILELYSHTTSLNSSLKQIYKQVYNNVYNHKYRLM